MYFSSLKRNLLFAFLFLVCAISMRAQMTGSFNMNIQFNAPPFNGAFEPAAFYVPPDYNPSNQYRLLFSKHGLGYSYTDFRDNIWTLSDSLDAIIVCPDDVDSPDLVPQMIDSVRSWYNIDPAEIYMFGHSWGASRTLDHAIANVYPFNGVIPLNGVEQSGDSAAFNAMIPHTCLCVGEFDNDVTYTAIYNNMTGAGASAYLNIIPGVGHSYLFATFEEEIWECFDWIDGLSVGIDEMEEDGFVVYPNPAGSLIRVEWEGIGEKEIALVDVAGREMMKVNAEQAGKLIDVSGLAAGLYHVVLRDGDRVLTRKLVRR